MSRRFLTLGVGALLLLSVLVGCGGAAPTPVAVVVTPGPQPEVVTVVVTPPPPTAEVPPTIEAPAGIEILEATFAHGLTDQMEPVEPGADFHSDETVYLSLKIKGRPKEGAVRAEFYWHDVLIADATVDLADANSGVLFSIGEDTYAGYTLSHDQPFPLSDQYRADVFYGDQALGSVPFHVVPPAGAIPSQIREVTLARGTDDNYNPVDPATTFAATDTVNLVGRGDLGLETWIQADWYVSGQLDEAGTRSLTLAENVADTGFAFSFLPDGGWPAGEHFVVLTMNDQEVGRYTFTVEGQ
jgi:hypothetical protein